MFPSRKDPDPGCIDPGPSEPEPESEPKAQGPSQAHLGPLCLSTTHVTHQHLSLYQMRVTPNVEELEL